MHVELDKADLRILEVLQHHGLDVASLAQRFRVALEPPAASKARPADTVAR